MAKNDIKSFETKELEVAGINFSPYNPRKIDDKTFGKLKKSIKEFGLVDPIIVNVRNMNAVGGNQRLRALKDLKLEKAHFILVDLDDAKEKALNVALNKISGEWDFDKLKGVMSELDDLGRGLTGFEIPEIEVLTGGVNFDFSGMAGDNSGGNESYSEPSNEGNYTESDGGASSSGENAANEQNEAPGRRTDGISYTIHVSFATKDEAEEFLKEHGIEHEFKGTNKTFVWRKNG